MNNDLLPVSEEILGAYLEGNLSPQETAHVEQLIASNTELGEIIDVVNEVEETIDYSASIYDDFPDFDSSFRLPVVPYGGTPVGILIVAPEDIEIVDDFDDIVEDDYLAEEHDNVLLDNMDLIDTDDFDDCM